MILALIIRKVVILDQPSRKARRRSDIHRTKSRPTSVFSTGGPPLSLGGAPVSVGSLRSPTETRRAGVTMVKKRPRRLDTRERFNVKSARSCDFVQHVAGPAGLGSEIVVVVGIDGAEDALMTHHIDPKILQRRDLAGIVGHQRYLAEP